MKKTIFSIALIAAAAFSGCKERNENLINMLPENNIPGEVLVIDSAYTVSEVPGQTQRNVIIEDFTGVKCINCPRASSIASELIKNNPGRVFALGIHPNGMDVLTKPFANSKYDFRTIDGTNLMNMLGNPMGLPMGAVNRKKFSGETEILLRDDKWISHTSSELKETAIANISFSKVEYNPSDRSLKVSILVTYTQATADANYLSLAISEDKLVDIQKYPTYTDSNYTHNHVFRKFAQPANGLQLSGTLEKGKTYLIKYNTILSPDWKAEDCHLIAILHKRAAPDFEVVQVKEEKVNK